MELFKLFGTIGLKGVDETKDGLDGVKKKGQETSEETENSSNKMANAFKKIGTAVVTYLAVDKVVGFGKAVVSASAEVSAEASAFAQIMGNYSDKAQTKLNEIANETGVVSSRLTPYMTSMTAKFKGLGFDIDKATTLASDGLKLASDASAFWDKSLEDSMGALNSFVNGSYEGGEAIGLFANETQLAQYAIKKGLVDSANAWSNLDEKTKQATRLEYAEEMYKLSGATGQAKKEANQYANVQANLNEEWRQFKATLGTPVLNATLAVMKPLGDGISYVNDTLKNSSSLGEGFKTVFTTFANGAQEAIPKLVQSASEMMNKFGQSIKDNLPNIVSKGLDMIQGFATSIAENAPTLIKSGLGLLQNLVQGIMDSLPVLIEKVPKIITTFANIINDNFPMIIAKGAEIIWNIITGIVGAIPTLIANIPQIFQAIFAVWNAINWLNLGKVLIDGLWNGVKTLFGALKTNFTNIFNQIGTVISGVWNGIKSITSSVWNGIKSFIDGLVNGIFNTVKGVFSNLSNSISTIFNAIKNFIVAVWNAIKSSISSVVNGISSSVSSIFNGLKNSVSNIFNGIKSVASSVWNGILNAIRSPMQTAESVVRGIINSIKGFFNFKISWPKIPLPHFSIKPAGWDIGDLLKGKIPSLGIQWYAKGGIMENPTIFGANGNNLMVGGEAGAEAIAPIDTLLGYVKTAVKEENANQSYYLQKLIDLLADFMHEITNNMKRNIVLDNGVLVGQLAPTIDQQLGEINRGRERGR